MLKHKDQRIGIFVDVQNLYYSARNIYNAKVNFKAILNEAIAGRKLIRAVAYVIRSQSPNNEEQTFFDALSKFGFEIKEKDLKTFYGGAKKGDWDVGIAMDMIRSKNLDVLVLVSGDGDFRPLVEYLKNNGQLVEAIAFGKSASKDLKEVVDDFIDLDKDNQKYLIHKKQLNTAKKRTSSTTVSTVKYPKRGQLDLTDADEPAVEQKPDNDNQTF